MTMQTDYPTERTNRETERRTRVTVTVISCRVWWWWWSSQCRRSWLHCRWCIYINNKLQFQTNRFMTQVWRQFSYGAFCGWTLWALISEKSLTSHSTHNRFNCLFFSHPNSRYCLILPFHAVQAKLAFFFVRNTMHQISFSTLWRIVGWLEFPPFFLQSVKVNASLMTCFLLCKGGRNCEWVSDSLQLH